ncbi:MAG: glycosyltransferase family 2 protein [Lachnospiraceae bacterium]|nr:glycosyltransferase family 2 protein [Lachnospiraceae bacterium]
MSLLSIIIPAYNEDESITHVLPALSEILNAEKIDFEVIFIDDGSADATFSKIKELSINETEKVRGFRLSRNFGKEAAIWAGLSNIKGDCCIVMDCDLQHPPEAIPEMFRLWEEGYEVVEGIKMNRGRESILYKLFAGAFYGLISSLSGFDMQSSSDFKLLDKRVVVELLKLKERNAFFRGLSFWVGFKSAKIEYRVAERKYSKSKWNVFGLFKYGLSNIIGFSTAPLQIVTVIGVLLTFASIILAVQTLVSFMMGYSLEGFTTVILLLLLIGGGLMISLGIIGLYIAKIYDEVKNRPRFIISESTEEKLL